jgi:hypothetical protein
LPVGIKRPLATTDARSFGSLGAPLARAGVPGGTAMGFALPSPGRSPVHEKNARSHGGWKYIPITAPVKRIPNSRGSRQSFTRRRDERSCAPTRGAVPASSKGNDSGASGSEGSWFGIEEGSGGLA